MKIIHYINQFFGQIGGEDKADYPLEVREEAFGPGLAFKKELGSDAHIAATIICGDNYFNENTEEVTKQIEEILQNYQPDIVIAGPAFNAGRYGMACGNVLKIASSMNITAVSGMFIENPGVDLYRSYGYIIETKNSAVGMKDAVAKMVSLIRKLEQNIKVNPEDNHYIRRGIRVNSWSDKTGAERGVDMLLDKLNGRPYKTELPMPVYTKTAPAKAIEDLSKATIALITTGGVVPIGNPDHIETALATRYGKYSMDVYGGADNLKAEVVHGGYDPIYCDKDPNRMVPVDVLKDFEREKVIGKLYDYIFATSGNGCSTANSTSFGKSIAKELLDADVDGILLTSA